MEGRLSVTSGNEIIRLDQLLSWCWNQVLCGDRCQSQPEKHILSFHKGYSFPLHLSSKGDQTAPARITPGWHGNSWEVRASEQQWQEEPCPPLCSVVSMGFSRQEHWSGWPFPFSKQSSWPRDQTHISFFYLTAGNKFLFVKASFSRAEEQNNSYSRTPFVSGLLADLSL